MNLYLAFGGFLIIAFLWAFILFAYLRTGFRIKNKSLILILFFFIGICAIIFAVGAVVEYTESPEFCGEFCHPRADLIVHDEPMRPAYESYKYPKNNTIMKTHLDNDVTCSGCHDAPGFIGRVEAYTKGIVDIYDYFTHNYDIDDIEAHVSDEYCLKCHDGELANKPGEVLTFYNTTIDPHETNLECADCHVPHQKGIGLSNETCMDCHGLDETQMENHEKTTQEECMECHNRQHPDYAYIPFSDQLELITNEFCADCHEIINNAFKCWSDTQKTIYGNCSTTCHVEHRESEVPHSALQPYQDNCDNCHYTGVASHSPSEINFYNFTAGIDNEFCSACHLDEYNAYSAWKDRQKAYYGNCVESCHYNHKESESPHQTTAPYQDNCDTCHLDGTFHSLKNITYSEFTLKIENEFCLDCHETEYDTLKLYNHNRRDCLECHGEHKKAQVLNFDDCSVCHQQGQVVSGKELNDIPGSHDENKKDCGDCHNIDVIHESKPKKK